MQQYTSPFHLLEEDGNSLTIENLNYQKLKRKLLARFELQDNEPLLINNAFVNKNEALELIQELKDENLLNFHKKIYEDKDLLRFLEEGNLQFFQKNVPAFQQDFKGLVSKYFAYKYSEKLQYAVKKQTSLACMVRNPLTNYVNDMDVADAYQRTYSSIKNTILEYENIENNRRSNFREQAIEGTFKLTKEYKQTLNLLPDYFQDLRDKFALTTSNIAVDLNNRQKDFKTASKYIRFAYHLKINTLLKRDLKDIYDTVSSNNKKINSDDVSWPRYIFLIVGVIIGLSKLNRCDDYYSKKSDRIHKNTINKILHTDTTGKSALIDKVNHFVSDIELFQATLPASDGLNSTQPANNIIFQQKIVNGTAPRNSEIKIRNTTDFDGVLFIRGTARKKEEFHGVDVFIHAKDTVTIFVPNNSFYIITGYMGNNWRSDTCAYCSHDFETAGIRNIGRGYFASKSSIFYKEHRISPLVASTFISIKGNELHFFNGEKFD